VLITPAGPATDMGWDHARSWRRHYHTRAAGVTGDNEGAGNQPPFPLAVLEPTPGVSEAGYRGGVEWVAALIARYRKLMDALADLHTATGPSDLIKAATVMALVQLLLVDTPPDSLALVLDLFPPQQAQRYNELVRGLIAAAVGVLRSGNMENSQIERWLDGEIRKRPALDFQAGNAMRWFFDCNSGKAPVPRGTLEAFRFFRPAPSLSLTEAVAKERAAQMLDTVAAMRAGPLTRPRPRR
jgi:hypothetical protein